MKCCRSCFQGGRIKNYLRSFIRNKYVLLNLTMKRHPVVRKSAKGCLGIDGVSLAAHFNTARTTKQSALATTSNNFMYTSSHDQSTKRIQRGRNLGGNYVQSVKLDTGMKAAPDEAGDSLRSSTNTANEKTKSPLSHNLRCVYV